MSLFTGMGVALVTPFGEKREAATLKLLDYIGDSADALVALGTTGEASTMTQAEKLAFVKLVKAHTKLPVIVGAGSNSTAQAVENTVNYKDAGADAVLIVTPYYNKCTQKGLIAHYGEIDKCGIPIIVYNVPGRTGLNVLPETAAALAELENVVAIKEASGNMAQIMETIRLVRGRIDVYSGDDGLTVPAVAMGAKGVISVAGNVAPRHMGEMTRLALKGHFKEAAAMQLALSPLIKALFNEVNPIPAKAALNLLGIEAGLPRLPLTPMEEKNIPAMQKCLEDLGLL